jgi:hypothetical protein
MLLHMWRLVVALVVTGGCEASLSKASLSTRDAFIDAAQRQNVDAIEARLADPLELGGMYFTDPACTQKFPAPRSITGADRRVFARCLAGLQLRLSQRENSVYGSAVFDYGPGIELEAVFRSRPEAQ